jgi:hypothetical protein
MKYKLTALTLIVAMSALMISPALAAAQASNAPGQAKKANSLALPISGTATDASGAVHNVAGSFNLQRFASQDGQLVGIGTLVATVTDSATGAVRTIVVGGVTAPVQASTLSAVGTGEVVAQQVACDILHLELGPLDLNLLGLRIQLSQVVLDITAEPGPGNLLGNLLCAIAGLLDPGTPGPLQQIIALLNQILQLLGG